MKMTEVKKDSDVNVEGVTIEFANVNPNRVTICDKQGNYLIVQIGQYSGLKVLMPAPPEKKKVWRIKGKFLEVSPVCEDFEEAIKADERLQDIQKHAPPGAPLGLEIVEVEIEEK